ncbi:MULTISPECIES: winged helix-turn-helix domain-containing protein [Brevibacterium]|uniref:Crosslink repair DNA glycosylase YcaQ family protein n=1 Tax=Brevibacterium salitolerans TaxID=1403566 RepID=A0ABP5HVZ6_9MICO|nr:crosslink repair DNA glycosylase YcaQ family protein [Brevibacterium sp.]
MALAASGLARARPQRPDAGHLRRTFSRLGVVQVDSVQAVTRSHYLPFFSRLGPYPRETLDRLLWEEPRMGVEYWAHEAAYTAPETVGLFHRRRAEWYVHDYGQRDPRTGAAFAALMEQICAELAAGPGSARELSARVPHSLPERARDHWGWNPSRVKSALEALLRSGRAACAGRNAQFERIYALPQHVHPALPQPPACWGPEEDPELGLRPDAGRIPRGVSGEADDALALVRLAAPALGLGTVDCFADYFRLPRAATAEAVRTLAGTGELVEVDVDGTRAWRWHSAVAPRTAEGSALLAPFDPLVFNRRRLSWLFGFDYRIEIYTPAERRRYGYYVMPFLHDGRIRARVDVRARRGEGVLVAGVHMEPGEDCWAAVEEELGELAGWLGLGEVVIGRNRPICLDAGPQARTVRRERG